ncbi:glycosyltransferase family 2 protein [Cryptosporangium japonicum]|uniref:Glycosyltransferase n=1 Tax=Cryptosporangium japonicum TaxID=80872 RepID=A0ABP3DRZ9_9ACTN
MLFLTIGWFVTLIMFWHWWLAPQHRNDWFAFLVNSSLLLYASLYPVLPIVRFNKITTVNPDLPVRQHRVAFCVTKAPSEPWVTARATLEAMLTQDFPYRYDVWLCDEDPSDEAVDWCHERGVLVSTRRGQAEYQREAWPRRAKCKEGNLAYFYDHYGYRDYDVVSQLDCDHVPSPTYLLEMVRPFTDTSVGYVAAPSICDSNADQSWSARGRLNREANFHGAYQSGCNVGYAPSCIGSHYAVRTKALREVGGLGPELAEDFTTTYLLSAAGWQGAFALNAEAHGEGPPTLAAMLTQEFQWSRSLTTVMLTMATQLQTMRWRLRIRFLHALMYYPVLAFTLAGGMCLAPAAVLTGLQWVNVPYLEFVVRFGAVNLWMIGIALLLQHSGVRRPTSAPVVSWEEWLYQLVRWPLILRGVLAAFAQRIRPTRIEFRVTPKGNDGLEVLPTELLHPFYLISLAMSSIALVAEFVLNTDSWGYLLLCLLAASTYTFVSLVLPLLHAHESAKRAGVEFTHALGATAAIPLLVAIALIVPLAVAIAGYPYEHLPHLLY